MKYLVSVMARGVGFLHISDRERKQKAGEKTGNQSCRR